MNHDHASTTNMTDINEAEGKYCANVSKVIHDLHETMVIALDGSTNQTLLCIPLKKWEIEVVLVVMESTLGVIFKPHLQKNCCHHTTG